MSKVEELLSKRSVDYLLDVAHAVSRDRDGAQVVDERLGRIVLRQLNSTLKVALDTRDLATFRKIENHWNEIPDGAGLWEAEFDSAEVGLQRYRRVLNFGLAMWATHLLRAPARIPADGDDVLREVLSLLASRISRVEDVFDVYEQAAERDDEDRVPWSNWFLDELPSGKVHSIPTSHELLFTALLLATALTDPVETSELAPREWLIWREEEVDRDLTALEEDAHRWAPIFVSPRSIAQIATEDSAEHGWLSRVDRLRTHLGQARERTQAGKKIAVRSAAIDPGKREEFERLLLAALREQRVIRHIFARQGALEKAHGRPSSEPELAFQQWLPKDLFIADSNVLGGDWIAKQLARASVAAEVEQLIAGLTDSEPRRCETEEELRAALSDEAARMRQEGHPLTLILAPITWRLREALGLSPVGHAAPPGGHDLVPATVAKSIAGIVEGAPLLDSPRVSPRSLWLLALPAAARMLEWPSDGDSGVRIRFETYFGREAAELVERQPSIVADDQTPAEAAEWIQEHVLLTQTLCWGFQQCEPKALRYLEIPEELAFDG